MIKRRFVLGLVTGFVLGVLALPLANDVLEVFTTKAEHISRDKYCGLIGKTRDNCEFEVWYYHYKKDNPKLEELSLKMIDIHTPLGDVITHRCNHAIFINPNVPEDSGKVTNRQYFECSAFQNGLNDLLFWEWK